MLPVLPMLPVPIPNHQCVDAIADKLEIGNIDIGNIFTLATFNKITPT